MGWWTEIRDGVETAASEILNYYYPGSGLLTGMLVSKGSQAQLSSMLGQLGMLGGGFAGGINGNMSNWSDLLGNVGGGGSGMLGGLFGQSAGEVGNSGITGAGTIGGADGLGGSAAATGPGLDGISTVGSQDPVNVAQRMLANGSTPQEVMQMTGITPQQAQMAGLSPGAGQTWTDVASQGGAQPGFNPTSSPMWPGNPNGTVMNPGGAMGSLSGGNPTAGSAGAMPWGSPGNVSTMGQGLYGLMQASQLEQQAKMAQQQADPFGPYRAQYGQQLSALTADPSLVTKLPGYQAGLQAIQRTMAAQGYTGSGNMMAAMQKYGGDFYNNAINQLSGLSGAQFNPAYGASLGMQGQQTGTNLAINSLGLLGKGAAMTGGNGGQWPWGG